MPPKQNGSKTNRSSGANKASHSASKSPSSSSRKSTSTSSAARTSTSTAAAAADAPGKGKTVNLDVIQPSFAVDDDPGRYELWTVRLPAGMPIADLDEMEVVLPETPAAPGNADAVKTPFQGTKDGNDYTLRWGNTVENESFRVLMQGDNKEADSSDDDDDSDDATNTASDETKKKFLYPSTLPFARHLNVVLHVQDTPESTLAPGLDNAPEVTLSATDHKDEQHMRKAYQPVPQKSGLKRRWMPLGTQGGALQVQKDQSRARARARTLSVLSQMSSSSLPPAKKKISAVALKQQQSSSESDSSSSPGSPRPTSKKRKQNDATATSSRAKKRASGTTKRARVDSHNEDDTKMPAANTGKKTSTPKNGLHPQSQTQTETSPEMVPQAIATSTQETATNTAVTDSSSKEEEALKAERKAKEKAEKKAAKKAAKKMKKEAEKEARKKEKKAKS